MAGNNNQFQREYPRNITDETIIWNSLPNGQGVGRFTIRVVANTVALTMFSGLPEDKERKYPNVTVRLDSQQAITLLAMLDVMRETAEHNHKIEPWKPDPLEISAFVRGRNGEKGEKRVVASFIVGRNDKGIYYVSLLDKVHGRTVFPLTFHRDLKTESVYNAYTGEKAGKDWESRCYAIAWVKHQTALITHTLCSEYVDKEAKKEEKKSKGNSDNSSSGSSGGNNYDNMDSEYDDFL